MTSLHLQCPCGNNKTLAECCDIVHKCHSKATHPEQLMRARYSAHVLGLVDFIINTYHPSCNAQQQREAIANSVKLSWAGLEVISSQIAKNNEGFVTFKAYYEHNGEKHVLQEKSRFLQEKNNDELSWFYIDGKYFV